jgi:hypothetical protein
MEDIKPIVMEKASIRYAGDIVTHRVHVNTEMTAQLADALGARWLLFDKGQFVRGGFVETKLEKTYLNAWLTHEIDKISTVRLTGVEIKSLRVQRRGDGKKKPKTLTLLFDVIYKGNGFPLYEHIGRITKALGTITIQPAQDPQGDLIAKNEEDQVASNMAEGQKKAPPPPKGADIFAMGKPTVSYKDPKLKDFIAALYISEGADGFYWCSSATIGKARLKPVKAAGPFVSEQAALNEASNSVLAAARPIFDGGTRDHKKAAGLMIEWAMLHIKQFSLTAAPDGEQPKEVTN